MTHGLFLGKKKSVPEKNINEVHPKAREFYEKGHTSLERDALDAAIHFLTETLDLEPGFLKARQALRLAQIRKSKTGGAMSKMFGNVTGSANLAKAFSNVKKDPRKAMEEAEKALGSNPYNYQALKLLAAAAETMGFLLTAIAAFETAREANPNHIETLMSLGRLHLANNQPTKAREFFERVRDLEPSNNDAFMGLKDATANEAMKKGGWEESTTYRDMIKDVHEARSLEQAAKIFKDEDIIQAQMQDVYKLTQEQPLNVSNWKKMGDLAMQINLFDHALQYYQHAFDLTQGADGNLERLVSDSRIKKLSYTLREKEGLLKQDPNNESLRQEIATLQQEQETATLLACEESARRYPNDLDIKYELARAYFRNNLIDKAIPVFQTASGNPKNKIACMNFLGQCFRQKGMLDLAIQRFKSAAEQCLILDNLKKDILYNLGTTYEQMGKKTEAIDQFKIIYDVDVSFKDVGKKIEDYYQSQSGEAPSGAPVKQ